MWTWSVIVSLSALCTGLLTLADVSSPVRTVISFWFFLVCPGMAYIQLLKLTDRVVEWTLAVALSIALDILVSEALIYTHAWSMQLGVIILMVLTAVGIVLKVVSNLHAGFALRLNRQPETGGRLDDKSDH